MVGCLLILCVHLFTVNHKILGERNSGVRTTCKTVLEIKFKKGATEFGIEDSSATELDGFICFTKAMDDKNLTGKK